MTDLMWQEHPSMHAQKSVKTVFFEENVKGSSPKWGDQEDEDVQIAPLWNYNATAEENASSSPAMFAERSNNGSHSGKDGRDPSSAEALVPNEADRSDASLSPNLQAVTSKLTPETAEKFKAFLKNKLQERQHVLSPSAPNSPSRVNPPASPKPDLEDEIMHADAQGNNLTIPLHLAEQIDASQEEEVDPESLLLPEMYTRYVRGELNSIEDVRNTYETLMGQSFGISENFVYDLSLRLMHSSDPIGLMAKNYAIKQD
jgi:hypothetical protein